MTTTSLPYGLQLEAGHFFTEFGRLNPRHPHQSHWQDQAVVNTRLFGPDGMRGPGFRLGWLMPLPWFSELHVGAQNANGETMASFLAGEEFFGERPIGNRPFVRRGVKDLKDLVYLVRLDSSWDLGEALAAKLGLSGLYGPNATGPKGETFIYGGPRREVASGKKSTGLAITRRIWRHSRRRPEKSRASGRRSPSKESDSLPTTRISNILPPTTSSGSSDTSSPNPASPPPPAIWKG